MFHLTDTQLFIACLTVLFLFVSAFAVTIYYRKSEDDKRELISN